MQFDQKVDQNTLDNASQEQLQQWEQQLTADYQTIKNQALNLDLTRGKPSAEQLSLSDNLDGILDGNYTSADGTDVRNYGGLDGLDEMKQLGAEILGVNTSEILVGGNSSLTLMFQAMLTARLFGYQGADSAWDSSQKGAAAESTIKFLCPVPGYDRHYTICEQLGIEMIALPMTATGPDMDQVEKLVADDASIKGIWCVPKYSNPHRRGLQRRDGGAHRQAGQNCRPPLPGVLG